MNIQFKEIKKNKMSKLKKLTSNIRFKNDGSCLVVKNLCKTTKESDLCSLVENCLGAKIFDTTRKTSTDDGKTNIVYTETMAFMAFNSPSQANIALLALHDKVLHNSKLICLKKKSKEEIARDKARDKAEIAYLRRQMREKQNKEYNIHRNIVRRQIKKEKIINESPEWLEYKQKGYRIIKPDNSVQSAEWWCTKCKSLNFSHRTVCFKCNLEKQC